MKLIISLLILSIAVMSCGGGYTTGTIQKAEKGFLKFTGRLEGIMISIDDGGQFALDPKIDLYEVKPGKHTVRIYRSSQIIVDRAVLIDNQTTFEIEVP